jgi:hypothetical protein
MEEDDEGSQDPPPPNCSACKEEENLHHVGSQDVLVGIAIKLRALRVGFCNREGKGIFTSPQSSGRLLGPPSFLSKLYRLYSRGGGGGKSAGG